MLRSQLVRIDLRAIRHNYRILKDSLPPEVAVMPVIKADAYGHGILQTADALCDEGAQHFAVALTEEGIVLREHGIRGEILVLGAAMPKAIHDAVEHQLTMTVFSPEIIQLIDTEAAKQSTIASVHIKLDTGMNRIGLRTIEEAQAVKGALENACHVKATGIFTHFAFADDPDAKDGLNDFTKEQLRRFQLLRSVFDASIPAHIANSALTLLSPSAYHSMVRQGISLYGYPPVPTELPFKPALSWRTEVVYVKEIGKGEFVGYGCTYRAEKTMRIATVAVGYGDGYHRAASNRAMMIIRGKRVPVVGRVCMDQTMVDVTELPECKAGDEVVLIGTMGEATITAEELATWADTISYEVLLAITPRVPRIYVN